MKKILITGANSYIGKYVKMYLEERNTVNHCEYYVDMISIRGESWRASDFSRYDVILHTAGIAHVDVKKKKDTALKQLYYEINGDLTIDLAKKARMDGVKQFIFMSSIIVYGEISSIKKEKIINRKTKEAPDNYYAESKLYAENGLKRLEKDVEKEEKEFLTAIIRSPMVYGKGCRGNYAKLAKLACRISFFPDVGSRKSMIYIENLCEYIKLIIDKNESGMFFPQNEEYVNVAELVSLIAEMHGKHIKKVKGYYPVLSLISHFSRIIKKVFGSTIYDKELTETLPYQKIGLRESIARTEGVCR